MLILRLISIGPEPLLCCFVFGLQNDCAPTGGNLLQTGRGNFPAGLDSGHGQ